MKLFSALKRSCRRRHRCLSVLALLPGITPVSSLAWLGNSRVRPLHLIMESDATFKHPVVLRWLNSPQFHLPFISPFSSWLNLIAQGFLNLAARRLCCGGLGQIREWFGVKEQYLPPVSNRSADIYLGAHVPAHPGLSRQGRRVFDKTASE